MDGLKKLTAIFAIIVVVAAFTTPALAQSYGGGMAQPQPGRQQTMPQQGGQGQQGRLPESSKDLMATMEGISDISMFTAAIKAAGYDQMLGQSQQQSPIMVFAPTDKALQRDMGISDVNALVSDPSTAKSLVENCIVTNVEEPPQGSDTITMTSIGGMQVIAKKSNTGITVNGLKVVNVLLATNGLLAVTDGVVGIQGAQ